MVFLPSAQMVNHKALALLTQDPKLTNLAIKKKPTPVMLRILGF